MNDWMRRRPRTLLAVLVAIGLPAAGCGGDPPSHGAAAGEPLVVAHVAYAGERHLRYRYGPIAIHPGQNPIEFRPTTQKPKVAGYITRFRPDLTYVDGTKPVVDVLHLHHGVWFMRGETTFATGEEKTITQFPRGFGYRYDPGDPWILNYMLHNLTPAKARVYLTWDVDFVPAPAAAAAAITEVRPLWLDVGKGATPSSTRSAVGAATAATRSPTTRAAPSARRSAAPSTSPPRRT
jgi:hypothetical protein